MKKIVFLVVLIFCLLGLFEGRRNKGEIIKQDGIADRQQSRLSKSKKDASSIKKESIPKKAKSKHVAEQQSHEHAYLHWNEAAFWWNTLLAIFLSCAGGFFSGMTVGLNSLDKLSLQVQQITGNKEERKMATRILSTIKDHHLFLVTLLIGNAMVLQWLPLVVHKIMPDWAAILTSTLAVVIVAQIVPMSYTTGPNKYEIAYIGAPMVDFCIKVYYVIAYPVARGLDKLLGVHDCSKIHRKDFLAFVNDKKKNFLEPLEITIFNQLFIGPHYIPVSQIMKPVQDLIILGQDEEITSDLIKQIMEKQNQYIFVVSDKERKDKLGRGIPLKMKKFMRQYLRKKFVIKDEKNMVLGQLFDTDQQLYVFPTLNSSIPIIYSDTGLLDAMLILNSSNSHFAFVHQDHRLRQNTDIEYLEAKDFIFASIYCWGLEDSTSILGVVFLNDIFEAVADFKGDVISVISARKLDQEQPPKKRKLVKRASIVSVHSLRSHDD